MLSFKCPQCSAENKLLTVRWRRLRGGEGWRCSSCGVKLEMENASLISILTGLLGGGLIMGLRELGIRSSTIRFALIVLVMWFFSLILVRSIARWKVKPEVEIDSPELRKWKRILNVSITIGLIVIISTQIFLAVELKRLLVMSASTDSAAAVASIQRNIDLVMLLTPIGLGLFLVTLAVDVFAALKCRRIRRLLTNDTPEAGPEGPA